MINQNTKQLEKKIVDFLADNKDLVIFIGDPKTSIVVGGYGSQVIARQIKDKNGTPEQIVAQALIAGNDGGQARFDLSQMFSAMLHGFARTTEDKKVIRELVKSKGRQLEKAKK